MTVPEILLVLIVVLNGLAALLACMTLLLWLAAQLTGQPISFREAFRGTAQLTGVLFALGVAALTVWLLLR